MWLRVLHGFGREVGVGGSGRDSEPVKVDRRAGGAGEITLRRMKGLYGHAFGSPLPRAVDETAGEPRLFDLIVGHRTSELVDAAPGGDRVLVRDIEGDALQQPGGLASLHGDLEVPGHPDNGLLGGQPGNLTGPDIEVLLLR